MANNGRTDSNTSSEYSADSSRQALRSEIHQWHILLYHEDMILSSKCTFSSKVPKPYGHISRDVHLTVDQHQPCTLYFGFSYTGSLVQKVNSIGSRQNLIIHSLISPCIYTTSPVLNTQACATFLDDSSTGERCHIKNQSDLSQLPRSSAILNEREQSEFIICSGHEHL